MKNDSMPRGRGSLLDDNIFGGGGNFSRKENWILQERKRWVLVFKGTVSQDRHFLIFDA